jgi:hypothetical protein
MFQNHRFLMTVTALALLLSGSRQANATESTPMEVAPAAHGNGSIIGLWRGGLSLTAEPKSAMAALRFSQEIPYAESQVLCLSLEVDAGAPANQAGHGALTIEFMAGQGKSAVSKASLQTGPNWLIVPLKGAVVAGKAPRLGKEDAITGINVRLGATGQSPADAKVRIKKVVLVDNKYVATNPPYVSPARHALLAGELKLVDDIAGTHPRVVVSQTELEAARRYFKTAPGSFAALLPKAGGAEMNFFRQKPASIKPPQDATRILAKLAAAYVVTGETKYRDALMTAVPYLQNLPPVIIPRLYESGDLIAGEVLENLSIACDLLHSGVPAELARAVCAALIRQAEQTHIDMLNIDRHAYMQNHFFTPVAGLLMASSALAGESPQASEWGVWSRNVLQRVRESLPKDAWCFESISYWNYQRGLFIASHALKAVYGEELISHEEYLNEAAYLAHIFLPNPDFVFDFGDTGPRVENNGKAQEGYDWLPWHTYPTRILKTPVFLVNREVNNPTSQEMVRRLVAATPLTRRIDSVYGLLLNQPGLVRSLATSAPASLPDEKPWRYFSDSEVVHWRENWTSPDAVAIAIKSGPPAGHRIGAFLEKYPHASRNFSHAHPDAGSFILFAKGSFLANDTGYTGKKETADHNSILVDDVGQKRGGTAWFTFEEPYDAYKTIRTENVWLAPKVVAATAIFDGAYDNKLKINKMTRNIIMVGGKFLVIADVMSATLPHVYEWRWHTDTAASKTAAAGGGIDFEVVNNKARLSLRSLAPVADASIAPTVVETELYSTTRLRPQQRGHHIALRSDSVLSNTFLNAARIGAATDAPGAFVATVLAPGKIKLTDGRHTCVIWLKGNAELDGNFAYLLYENAKQPLSCGLSGTSVRSAELTLRTKVPGQVTFSGNAGTPLAIETAQPEENRDTATPSASN